MTPRIWLALPLAGALVALPQISPPLPACCPAPPSGKPVVNADQTILMIWDAGAKTQHFIRQASFKSEADDFGFVVPTPSQPEMEESGNEAFPYLLKVTEPEKVKMPRPSGGMGCGCSASPSVARSKGAAAPAVAVLAEKLVAGFQAVVLEAESAAALTGWLKDHGYAYSPEIEAWAKPYVEKKWKFTALKVAKGEGPKAGNTVGASALRLSFKTDTPVFPYREPDPTSYAKALGASHRLLRIYFVAEARYRGDVTKKDPWTAKVAWAGKLTDYARTKLLDLLKLPPKTGPAEWWLTEFEDDWPYRAAPADVTFSRDPDQREVRRPPIIEYVAASPVGDVMACALGGALVLTPLLRRYGRKKRVQNGRSVEAG